MIDCERVYALSQSGNYKDRFIAEYCQLIDRYNKLHRMLVKWEAGTLDFQPACPFEVLEKQAAIMGQYLKQLEIRAEIEGIDIETEVLL